jgi:hypothetical protein
MSGRNDNRTAMQGSGFREIPSEAGEVDIKLGEVARVSDFKPAGFVGVAVDSGVGSSPAVADMSLSGLSESGRR